MRMLFSNKQFKTAVLVFAMVMCLSSLALANTSNGTEFQSLYDMVVKWATGMPAIIIAIGIALVAIMRAFQSGSFVWALAGILVAALIFLLPNIISGLGGATI